MERCEKRFLAPQIAKKDNQRKHKYPIRTWCFLGCQFFE